MATVVATTEPSLRKQFKHLLISMFLCCADELVLVPKQ